jgi:SNF2 family DNA or RNA helicase
MDFIEETDEFEKIVIFSQYETALKLLESRIRASNYWKHTNPYGYARYTGQSCGYVPYGSIEFKNVVDPKSRKASPKGLEDIFQTDPTIKIWEASLKASGELLTLTAASIVVALDQWWNDASMQQAYDRIHRHGQKNVCRIIRVIAEDTIELDILELIASKASEFTRMIKTREFLLELLLKDKERSGNMKKAA